MESQGGVQMIYQLLMDVPRSDVGEYKLKITKVRKHLESVAEQRLGDQEIVQYNSQIWFSRSRTKLWNEVAYPIKVQWMRRLQDELNQVMQLMP
jgi:hypothetical protein